MTKRKHLTQTEVESMLDMAKQSGNPERDYCFLYMSFIHGFRVSEACRLRVSDLDLKHGSLYIRRMKNGFSTNHPLLSNEIRAIKAWVKIRKQWEGAESDWLFLSRQGGPHMLRHACGFALADRGVDTRLIQDYLGHRNIRHTVRYTASNAERFKDVWRLKNKHKKLHLGPNCQLA